MNTRLSVNVNKVALLRNSRGGQTPNLMQYVLQAIKFGAQGITVHPRPDGRHVLRQDVFEIAGNINVEFNIEGYPSNEFMEMVCKAKPAQCTLVPDPPGALTSNAGWNMVDNMWYLRDAVDKLHKAGIRTSIFVDADIKAIEEAAKTKTDAIELYTGPYAEHYPTNREAAVRPYIDAAAAAHAAGLLINAGHDLNLDNLRYFKQNMPHLAEVSIGHAIVADALYLGLEETLKRYLQELQG